MTQKRRKVKRYAPPPPPPPPRTALAWRLPRRVGLALALAMLVPLVALLVLRETHVPVGEPGETVYLFSAESQPRLFERAWPGLLAGAVVAAGVWQLAAGDSERRRRRIGAALTAVGVTGLVVWTWWAPPIAVAQYMINLLSPAQDGAFLIEPRRFPSGPRDYLRQFESRIQLSPHEMGSTRVMSNPPGMTLLAYAATATRPYAHGMDVWLLGDVAEVGDIAGALSPALRFALLLAAMWGASAMLAYLAGRQVLSPAGAATFALVVTFNPCTVNFVPGKDPAQLLTINAMIWTWLIAWAEPAGRRATAWGLAAGLFLVAGAVCGLIHLWVAAAVFVATAWTGGWRSVLRPAAGAVVGAALGFALLRVTLGWNAPHTMWAVYRRFKEVQPIIYPHQKLWFVIGLPIFLLFVSPGLVVPAWMALRQRGYVGREAGRSPLGRPLFFATLVVMALTYVFGVTYELPRLWVAFLPPLTLGAMAACPTFRGSWRTSRHARWVLFSIVAVQVVFTIIHVSLMDARESEQRILSHRLFW